MKYSGSSIVTPRQVGSSAVVLENDVLWNVDITKTRSIKRGEEAVVIYYLTDLFPTKWFLSTEVFDDTTDAKAEIPEN